MILKINSDNSSLLHSWSALIIDVLARLYTTDFNQCLLKSFVSALTF